MEAAAMVGLWPRDALAMTLPELVVVMRGRQRASGIDPDAPAAPSAMTYARLLELAKEQEK